MCHLVHIFTFPSQVGLSCGSCLLKVSFQDLPVSNAKSLSCAKFLMRLPLPFLLLPFFLFPPFPLPLFPAMACLVYLAAAVLDEFATFLKDAGKFIWKAPLSTCSSKSLNSRTLLLTCVHAMLACLYNLNLLWTLRFTANRNFAAKNLSRAIWLQRGFLLPPTRSSSWLILRAKTLASKKYGWCCCKQLELGPETNKVFRYVYCLLEWCFDIVNRLLLTLFLDWMANEVVCLLVWWIRLLFMKSKNHEVAWGA